MSDEHVTETMNDIRDLIAAIYPGKSVAWTAKLGTTATARTTVRAVASASASCPDWTAANVSGFISRQSRSFGNG
jgi:hypothetical protein